jgi:hypothetical protein
MFNDNVGTSLDDFRSGTLIFSDILYISYCI